MPQPHPLDAMLQLQPQPDGSFVAHTHAGYANMVGPYGGATAALLLHSVLQHPDCLGQPLSLTVNFAGPVQDGAMHLVPRAVRTNRSTQHWVVSISQTDPAGIESVVITATAVTAARRTTWSAADAVMPSVPVPGSIARASRPARVAWIQRYDMRPCSGEIPADWNGAEADSLSRLWMRDDPPRPLDFCSLTALADVFYPRVWRRRALMTPVGTVSMTVYFHAGAAELAATGEGYLLGQARAQSFFNGFFDQSAELWNEAGDLLATTHQIVYFKE